MHTPNPRHHSLSAFDQKLPDRRKVGDTLTAIALGGEGPYTYAWTLNGNTVGYSATFTIPTTSKEGDVIAVTVTDEEGNTATDSVIVGATTELALNSVEGAAIDRASGTYNVVIAYFNQPVDGLAAGDVQIRRVSDDQLFSVESVALSSDGMKATITLANSGSAGASVVGLRPNVDYNMIVTSEGDTASKIFSIPAVVDNVIVSAFDADKGTIVVGTGNDGYNGTWSWSETSSLTVPEDMTIDYNDLLGRTVTVKYDKKMNITSLVVDPDETVIYGAFKGSATNKNLTEVVSEATFKALDNAAGTIDPSTLIAKTDAGWNAPVALTEATLTNDALAYSWGKLVLNPNNTIKVLVSDSNALTPMLVTTVNGNMIQAGKVEQNLKDFTILEDGETITVDDIEEGDMVFYDRLGKLAVVYNNAETGELEAVYDGKFKVDGTTYDVAHDDSANALDSTVYYNKSGKDRTTVNNDYLNGLTASGEEVTIYFGLNGQPAYLEGTVGETVTTKKPFVLVSSPKFYNQSLNNYLRVKGYDGDSVTTYDIDISKLDFIVDVNGKTFKKGYNPDEKGGAAATKDATNTIKGFEVGTVAITDAGVGSIKQTGVANGFTTAVANLIAIDASDPAAYTAPTTVAGNNLLPGAYITLTFNEDGDVIGINFEDASNGIGDVVTATSASNTFKAGLTTVKGTKSAAGLQCKSSTPLYFYDLTKGTVTETTLGEFTGQATTLGQVYVYSANDKDVTAFVTSAANAGADTAGHVKEEVVVKSTKRTTDDPTKLAELTVIFQGEEYTFTKFVDAVANDPSPATGSIVTITINKDGETIDAIATADPTAITSTITVTSVNEQTFTLGLGNTGKKLASTVEPTIAVWDGSAYVAGTFADLQDADTTNTTPMMVSYSYLGTSTTYVDTIVVTNTTVAKANAITAANNAIATANTKATPAIKTTAAYTELVTAITDANAAVLDAVDEGATAEDSATADVNTTNLTAAINKLADLNTDIETAKAKFVAKNYSAASSPNSTAAVTNAASLGARIVCADDGIVNPATSGVVGVAAAAAASGDTSVTVTATFLDGTTSAVTLTTDTLATAITANAAVYTLA